MRNLKQLESEAIKVLKSYEPEDGYFLGYSGGKDSDVIKILATLAGVKFEAVHNLITVDAPETIAYIKSQPDVRVNRPGTMELDGKTVAKSMWRLIEKNTIPPTRLIRYCCKELKERNGKGKVKIFGVRKAESNSRNENADLVRIIGKPKTVQIAAETFGVDYRVSKQGGMLLNQDNDESRRLVEKCYATTSTSINPIVDWSDGDVYEFLRYYGCKMNPLYGCGFSRVGCVGCPMVGSATQQAGLQRYPKYRENYIKSFQRMVDRRKRLGLGVDEAWRDGESVMRWWLRVDGNQLTFDDVAERENK